MALRHVYKTAKDPDGDITMLCNRVESWSPRLKENAISDIESNTHSYVVPWSDGVETPIRVVNGPTGKYLRTDRDQTERNNLGDLPDC